MKDRKKNNDQYWRVQVGLLTHLLSFCFLFLYLIHLETESNLKFQC